MDVSAPTTSGQDNSGSSGGTGGMQMGGWYNNPAAGGQNQRYWGPQYGWTTGSDPTQGGASPSGAAASPSTPSASPSGSPDIMQYYQGWNSDQAQKDFQQAYGGDINRLLVGRGLAPNTILSGNQPQAPDLSAMYNSAMADPNMVAAEKAITDSQAQVDQRRQALASAQGDINDNPFYSEATRTGKLAKEQAAADADISTYQNSIAEKQNNYNQLKANALQKIGYATQQYSLDNSAYQQHLSNFDTMLKSGTLNNATPQDIANLSVTTGLPASEVSAMIRASSTPRVSPKLITSTDNSGNLTLALVDQNSGNILNMSRLGGVGKARTTGTGTASGIRAQSTALKQTQYGVQSDFARLVGQDGYVSPQTYEKAKANASNAGLGSMSPAQFDATFAKYRNPNNKYYWSK